MSLWQGQNCETCFGNRLSSIQTYCWAHAVKRKGFFFSAQLLFTQKTSDQNQEERNTGTCLFCVWKDIFLSAHYNCQFCQHCTVCASVCVTQHGSAHGLLTTVLEPACCSVFEGVQHPSLGKGANQRFCSGWCDWNAWHSDHIHSKSFCVQRWILKVAGPLSGCRCGDGRFGWDDARSDHCLSVDAYVQQAPISDFGNIFQPENDLIQNKICAWTWMKHKCMFQFLEQLDNWSSFIRRSHVHKQNSEKGGSITSRATSSTKSTRRYWYNTYLTLSKKCWWKDFGWVQLLASSGIHTSRLSFVHQCQMLVSPTFDWICNTRKRKRLRDFL